MSARNPAACEIVQTISRRMSALREARRMTLDEVAASAQLAKSHVWEIEKGRAANPTVATVVSLARVFGVSVDYLTGLSSQEPSLHPEALRLACDIDRLLRSAEAARPNTQTEQERP